mmetsp:Transcript_29582/g.114147  ORF Transcript_29582/g.114147 Transcript_29582/m.114147 type:complete len:105 (+) Transcript_29582:365-679(+)
MSVNLFVSRKRSAPKRLILTHISKPSRSCGKAWRSAVKKELDVLNRSGTWQFSEVPEGRRALTTKWAFTIKRDASGKPIKRKARLAQRDFYRGPAWTSGQCMHQ